MTGDELTVDYDALRYIELAGDGSKIPAKKWGGYSQDFDEAEHVLDHDEIEVHPSDNWGIVDVKNKNNMSISLLIFDIDIHKAPNTFDESRLDVPADTLITRSQNGGFHVYFKIHKHRGELNESDFEVTDDLPFDIDIRGSAVSHHVVAPNDIPGVGGNYEIVNDEAIKTVIDPDEAAHRIELDGEPAIEVNRDGPTIDSDWEPPEDAPKEMPTCYHAGLALRREAPDDHGHTHKVNVLAALCGLAAGYDPEEVATHMCGEYAPKDGGVDLSDREKTEYQVQHLYEKLESGEYSPPAISTLQNYGILGEDEGCTCPIDSHGGSSLNVIEDFVQEYDAVRERPDKPDLSDDDVDLEDPEVQEALAAWPDVDELNEIADAVVDLSDDAFEEYASALADRLKSVEVEDIAQHRRVAQAMREQGGTIVNVDDRLVSVETNHRWLQYETLLNFELDVTSLLSIEGEDRMANVEVRPAEPSESAFEMQIEPRVFNDARRFKDEVLSKRFSTTIETSMHESDVMDLLRKYISRQDVPDLVGQKQMGLSRNGDEFVTPNGTINADGWADDPDTIHVERDIGAERKFQADPDDHNEPVNEDVARMIELFTRTRDTERFVPVLGWMYAAPFRPEIVERTGSFNLLHVNGEAGVGKTGTLGVGNRLLGMTAEPFSCTDTTFATITTLASSRGVPVWLDEYKTSEMADWQQNKLHELLRKAATGGVEQRGRADQTTEEYHLRAPVVISGETAIRGSAEQRRAIDVTFTDAPTQPGTSEYRRFKELVGDATTDEEGTVTFPDARYDLEEHAVAYYTYVAGTSSEEFEAVWYGAREYVSKRLAKWDVELDDLEVQGLQTIVAGYQFMISFANAVGADLDKLPSEEDLDDALRYVADVDGDGRETHADQFVGLVQRATVAGYLEEGTHWRVVHEGKAGEELRVNVTQAFDAVSKYVRDHDLNEDLLGSSEDYNSRYDEAVEQEESYVMCTSQPTQSIGRAVGIHTGRAEDQLSGFDRIVFMDSDDDGDGEVVNSDGDNGDRDGPTPLKNIDADDDYVTVTVEVVNWSPTPVEVAEAGGPVESGSVVDVTGRRDVVLFDEPYEGEPSVFSERMEEGETVRIEHAAVTEYDGAPQLVLDAGTTITPIQQGVGHTETVDVPDGQATMDTVGESIEDAVRPDGGESDSDGDGEDDSELTTTAESQYDRMKTIKRVISDLEGDIGAPTDVVIEDVAAVTELDREAVEEVLKKLEIKGEVYEPHEGYLRRVGGA